MKDFYVIFKMSHSHQLEMPADKKESVFYRYVMKARSFGEAERKFNKQTSNKFGQQKHRVITEIRIK